VKQIAIMVSTYLPGIGCSVPIGASQKKGHTGVVIGLSQFRDEKKLALPWLLILPIVGDPGKQPINRHG